MEAPDKSLIIMLTSTNIDPAIKTCAIDCLLGLTGSAGGIAHLIENSDYLRVLCHIISKDTFASVIEKAMKCLVNVTADADSISKIVEICPELIATVVSHALTNQMCVQLAFMVLANMSRLESALPVVLSEIKNHGSLQKLVQMLNRQEYSESSHYAALVLSNLSQSPEARRELMENDFNLFSKLLSFTTYPHSGIRRFGIVGTIKNCCFDTDFHRGILDDKINLLTSLCLPLSGPETLDDEDMEKLPLDLQYLGEEKTRDADPQIRKMCIEALNQLCATKHGREILRNKSIYFILRELHKTEEDVSVLVACENLVDILISDEPAPEYANLKKVNIPADLAQQFEEMNVD